MVPSHPCQLYSKPTKIDDVISHENYVIIKAFGLAQLFFTVLSLCTKLFVESPNQKVYVRFFDL